MILIVDDQPDAGQLLCRLLGRCGYQCTHCTSAREALEVLGTIRPEMAILDVMMPEMDGLELLKEIRDKQDLAGLPVVMYSASPDEGHQATARKLHASAYLLKGSASVIELLGFVSRYGTPGKAC